MTDQMESTITEAVTGSTEPKLFAGKYKTVEELEEGYKAGLRVHLENKELKERYAIPDDYTAPEGVSLRENELNEIKYIAKNSNLTQDQFEKTVKAMESRIKSQREAFDKARQEIGNERLVVIEDYVRKTYPESLQQSILNTAIKDKKAMDDIMKQRDRDLDSTVPGISVSGNRDAADAKPAGYDGQREVMEAAREYERNPSQANKDRYIRLATEVGNERFKDKVRQR